MSYRNGVMIPEPPGKGRRPLRRARHYYYNEGEPSPYDLTNNSSPADCYDHEWDRRSSSRKVSSSTESHEKRNRASWSRVEREDEHESMDYFGDNNERLSSRNRRSQSPSFNNNNSNRTIILSSNVERHHQKSRKKSTHRHQWDSLRISIDNKPYHDGNHHGSFSSQRGSSSQDFPSYEPSRSKSRERSSRSYYDSGNERKFPDPYQSRVDEFIRENLNASRHKSSQPERDSSSKDTNPTRKKELLEKLLQVKDPDFERELEQLIKEKIGKHSRGSQDRDGNFQRSDYEQRERLPDRKSRSWNHRSPSPSSYSRSNRDWYEAGSASGTIPLEIRAASSTSPLRGIRYSDMEDGDTALYGADGTYRARSTERFVEESSDLHGDELLDESGSYTDIGDSRSEHNMWSTIQQVLKEQKQERGFWQSSISKKVREPITPDETSQIEDPTIRNILKSIGFDFEMSKRMQERAKQVSSQPEYLRTDKGDQYDQQGILNVPAEIDKGLMERTQMQILTIEKSLPPHLNASVLSPSTNSPAALRQPLLPTPHTNSDQPSLSPQEAGYGLLSPLSAGMSPHEPFLSQQQTSFAVRNQYSKVQKTKFDYSLYGQNPDYDSTSALRTTVPSNRKATYSLYPKSDLPAPCATASASLPGFYRRDDRSPHSFTRHGSSRSPCWSPEREWSPRRSRSRSRSPPPRRDRSPSFSRNRHEQYYRSRRSRDRSPDSWKELAKRDRSPLHQIHPRVSQRTRSSRWFNRETTPPKYDHSPHTQQWHGSFPTRQESPRRGRSLKQSWSQTDSRHGSDANLDESGSRSGDSVEDPDSLSPQEIEQIKAVRLDHISKMKALRNVLNKLVKQQNEMMRKKQRVKDGHKDPLLLKNAALQEEIISRISPLSEAIEELSHTLLQSGVKLESYKYSKKLLQGQRKSQVESSDQSPPTLGCGLSCESLQSSKSDPPFPLKRKACSGKVMDDDSMSSDGRSSSGKKMPPFPLQKISLLPESSADERKMSENEESVQGNSCNVAHQNLDQAADLQNSPPGENEQEKNNDACEDEEVRKLPKRGRQGIKKETVKKKQRIEKTKESAKESSDKDPEISKPSDLDDYIKLVSDDVFLKEETNRPVSGFKKTKISIKLTGKTRIKPVIKDPVVPSAIPATKMPTRKKGRGLKTNVGKKIVPKEIEEPLSLNDFLTSSNKGYIPIVSEEDVDDLKLLGIDPASQVPMAEIRQPPLPLLHQKNDETEMGDKSETPTASPETASDSTEMKGHKNSETVAEDGVADVLVLVYGPNREPEMENPTASLPAPVDQEIKSSKHDEDDQNEDIEDKCSDLNVSTSSPQIISPEMKGLEKIEKVAEDGVADVPVLGSNTEDDQNEDIEDKCLDLNVSTSSPQIISPEMKGLKKIEKVAEDGVADVPVLGSNTEDDQNEDIEDKCSDLNVSTSSPQIISPEMKGLEKIEKVAEDGVADVPVLGSNTEPETEKTEPSLGLDQPLLPLSNPTPSRPAPVDQEINSLKHDKDDQNEDIEDECSDLNESTSSPQGSVREYLDDLKHLGIDPASQVPIAEIRPPPSPLPLLHEENDETEMEDKSETPADDDENTSPLPNENCSISDSSKDV